MDSLWVEIYFCERKEIKRIVLLKIMEIIH